MVNCTLTKEVVPVDKCMFCDYCKGSFVENNKTITLCAFSKTQS